MLGKILFTLFCFLIQLLVINVGKKNIKIFALFKHLNLAAHAFAHLPCNFYLL